VGEDRQSGRRVTVDEAARHLGLTVDAVRKRVQRGQIAYKKDQAGRVRIILDEGQTLQDKSPDSVGQAAGHGELVEELRDRVHSLERMLEEEREARTEERRRHDTLMAQLMQRLPELEAPASTSEAREPDVSPGPTDELGEAREELGAEQARREMAESTLHEGMAEEQRRREEAEQERDDLRRELYALREPRESPETAEEQQGRGEPRSTAGEAQESSEAFGGQGSGTARGSWWRRMFGG
jgi:hypothetical protein